MEEKSLEMDLTEYDPEWPWELGITIYDRSSEGKCGMVDRAKE